MRYRKLDPQGDYSFGQGEANFYIDVPAAVGQSILTRLKLLTGEWFLDITAGTPYDPDVIGAHTQATRDLAIRSRIQTTVGVKSLDSYASNFDPKTRAFTVAAQVTTIYGGQTAIVSATL